MKNESATLSYQQGGSDKVYNVELTQVTGGWFVNFQYGRRGNALTNGSKTKTPVPYDKAKNLFDKLVRSKIAKGYYINTAISNVSIPIRTPVLQKADILPQLLNEITEAEAEEFIKNPDYCMQEKSDGQRRMIKKIPIIPFPKGINKKGILGELLVEIAHTAIGLGAEYLVDGEDMGDHIILFDDLTEPELAYILRYEKLCQKYNNVRKEPELRIAYTAWTTEEKQKLWDHLKDIRAEGAVFKNIHAPHNPGRPASGGGQYKCKFYEEASCIVSSVSTTKSSIGLQVVDEFGNRVNVGNTTVYTNSEPVAIGDIVEIKYLYYNEGGSLYQPVLKGLRNDVDAIECTLAKLKRKKDVSEETKIN